MEVSPLTASFVAYQSRLVDPKPGWRCLRKTACEDVLLFTRTRPSDIMASFRLSDRKWGSCLRKSNRTVQTRDGFSLFARFRISSSSKCLKSRLLSILQDMLLYRKTCKKAKDSLNKWKYTFITTNTFTSAITTNRNSSVGELWTVASNKIKRAKRNNRKCGEVQGRRHWPPATWQAALRCRPHKTTYGNIHQITGTGRE